jgi:hypothetical protein
MDVGGQRHSPSALPPAKRPGVRHLKTKKYPNHSTTTFIGLKPRNNNRKQDTKHSNTKPSDVKSVCPFQKNMLTTQP